MPALAKEGWCGAVQLDWILRLGIPAPECARRSGKHLLPLTPTLVTLCLHLPIACEKIEGLRQLEAGFSELGAKSLYLQTKPPGFPDPTALAKLFLWASPSHGSCWS